MSVSIPSREAIIIDIPDIKVLSAKFQYNFFVPDEATNESGGVPKRFLEHRTDAFDNTFIDTMSTRVSRYVRLDFTPISVASKNKLVDDMEVRNNKLGQQLSEPNYIGRNLDKILHEDFFAAENFTAINLSDQSIDTKLYNIISGTAMFLVSDKEKAESLTHKKLARETDEMTSDNVELQFISKYLIQPSENNVFFFQRDAQRIRNKTVNRLKDLSIHFQINNKFINSMTKAAVVNPQSTFSGDFVTLQSVSKVVQQRAMQRSNADIARDDYKVVADYVSVTGVSSTTSTVSSAARIVGYVIDKYELLPNGTVRPLEPIIIENPNVGTTIDLRVKYYSNYVYSVRAIAEFTMPAIADETGELVIAKFLISSRPSQKVKVSCHEVVPPPPPSDFNFHWDYERGNVFLTWSFPPNSQRDIKKFQVFRRSSLEEPFQLLQVFDFDDAEVKAPPAETIFPWLVIKAPEPALQYTDYDFKRDSKYIYALGSVDAHGMVSNYSEQFEITFDRFKNRLVKKRISSSGAPKPYPNMYLLADTFVDLMLDEGHRQVDVVFEPEYLSLFDAERNDLGLLATTKKGASYKLQFMNLDLQKQKTLEISIDDLRKILSRGVEKT